MLGHEIDRFRRDVFGGHDEVAFVLAVFLVDEDDHLASLDVGEDVLDGGNVGQGRCHVQSSGLSRRSQ